MPVLACADYLRQPFRKSGLLCAMEQAFLLKYVRYAYNQRGPCCGYALTTRLFSQRRGSIHAVCISLDQAMCLFSVVWVPRTCLALDQAIDDFPNLDPIKGFSRRYQTRRRFLLRHRTG